MDTLAAISFCFRTIRPCLCAPIEIMAVFDSVAEINNVLFGDKGMRHLFQFTLNTGRWPRNNE